MKEADLWRKIRNGTKSLGIHWSRVESWAGPGVPDLNGCYKGHEFWIELKVRRSKRIIFRPHQMVWHYSRIKAGGSSFIVIGDPRSGVVDLYTGSVVRRLIEDGAVDPIWSSLIRKCDWRAMVEAILDHRSVMKDPGSAVDCGDHNDKKEVA
jgi:hypothetical protein